MSLTGPVFEFIKKSPAPVPLAAGSPGLFSRFTFGPSFCPKSCPCPKKIFTTHEEQLLLLSSRGMLVEDTRLALGKLSEIGYYRLSGFWHPCRQFLRDEHGDFVPVSKGSKIMRRSDVFEPGTSFNNVLALYAFDKSLRMLMLEALESIEIYMRSLIEYTMSRRNPFAWQDSSFVAPHELKSSEKFPPAWDTWKTRLHSQIDKSNEECIKWYKAQHGSQFPFWVVVQIWDFGLMATYFSMLRGKFSTQISQHIHPALPNKVLTNWLRTLNILRNRCAHHSRIWNRSGQNVLLPDSISYFHRARSFQPDNTRLSALITVMWFLVRSIDQSSTWLDRVQNVLKTLPSLPNCSLKATGFDIDLETAFSILKQEESDGPDISLPPLADPTPN